MLTNTGFVLVFIIKCYLHGHHCYKNTFIKGGKYIMRFCFVLLPSKQFFSQSKLLSAFTKCDSMTHNNSKIQFLVFSSFLHAASRSFMNTIVHEFVNVADHTKYNETAFKEFLNPRRFAHISGASKYMRSARNLIPLAPLVHGFTSEPK